MKFDSIVIGGGLSGITCGISMLKSGMKVAIVSFGQSSMHFGSGSFDLLGYDSGGNRVMSPLDAAATLDKKHPYKKVGVANIATLAQEAKELLLDAGIGTCGEAVKNHFRITPIGAAKPTWLTSHNFITLKEQDVLPWKRLAVANIIGYLDFPTQFLVANLRKMGAEVELKEFTTPSINEARKSPSEMRSIHISKLLTDSSEVNLVASEINRITDGYEAVLLPGVIGMDDSQNVQQLKQLVKIPLRFVATLPPSVPGIYIHSQLKKLYLNLGGIFFEGDQVVKGNITDGLITGIETAYLTDEELVAKNYVLASGSFMSHGLIADYNKVFEPIFNADVDAATEREKWTNANLFDAQPFMEFGIATDENFNVKKDGKPISNLFAIGSILSGHNQLKLADSEGVRMLTALRVAKIIARTWKN